MTDYSLFKKLRFDLSGNIGIGTTRPQSKVDISGNVQILGHVTPSTSLSYDLGSSTKRWRDLYLSGNTIDLGGTLISKEANGGIKIADNLGNTLDGKFNNLVINGAINQATQLDVSGSILPTRNLIYDLGAPDKRWNDLYLSGNTIDLSGTLLSRHVDGSFMVHDSNNNMISGRFADVTATGNIGVGTDYPLYKMHVIGDTRIQGNLIINGTTTVVDTNVNTTEMLEITNDGTGPALRVTQTGVQPIADFCDDASNNVVMRIADGGNVGIGTLIPKSKLDVNGTITAIDVSANLFRGKLAWTDVSGAPPYELAPGSVIVYDGIAALDSSFIPADGRTLNRVDYPELANALNIPVYHNTFTISSPDDFQVNWNETDVSSSTYIVNKPNIFGNLGNNGNVGIGTSNPGAALDVSGNIYIRDGTVSNPALTFSADTNTGFYRAGNDTLGFVTGGSERMRIDATGNIGIGTNNPQEVLHVNGNIYANGVHKVVTINLSAQNNTIFYPVCIDDPPIMYTHYFSIEMPSLGGGSAYNMHSLHAVARGGGWSDQRPKYEVFHNYHDTNERSILGIYGGIQEFQKGIIVYLRGGQTYTMLTNSKTVTTYTSVISLHSGNPTYQSVFALKNASGADVSGTSSSISLLWSGMGIEGKYYSHNLTVNGYIKNLNPCFYAYRIGANAPTVQTSLGVIPLDATEVNIQNVYNTSDYTFTAPISGIYRFSLATLHRGGSAGSTAELTIEKKLAGTSTWVNNGNRNTTTSRRSLTYSYTATSPGHSMVSGFATRELITGDSIRLVLQALVTSGDLYIGEGFTYFEGYLIG